MPLICEELPREFNVGFAAVIIIFLLFFVLVMIGSFMYPNSNDEDYSYNTFVKIFSLQDNINDLITPRQDQHLLFMDGIRVWSIIWLIFAHSFQAYILSGMNDLSATIPPIPWIDDMIFFKNARLEWNGYITHKLVSIFSNDFMVDTFLVLSGFFGCFSLYKMLSNTTIIGSSSNGNGTSSDNDNKCKCKICCKFSLISYLQRYLRLMPMIIYVVLITMNILDQIPNGSHITSRSLFHDCCASELWTKLFLIGNFSYIISGFKCSLGCLGHLWFIYVDFQLFLLLPMSVYLFYKKGRKFGIKLVTFFIILGIVVRAIMGGILGFVANINFPGIDSDAAIYQFVLSYDKPWGRMSAYFCGVLLAMIMININDNNYNFKLSHKRYFSIQIFVGVLFIILLLVPYDNTIDQPLRYWNKLENIIFYIISKPLWGATICLFIFALRYKDRDHYGSFAFNVLSGIGYKLLAQLSFQIYLIHYFYYRIWNMVIEQPVYYNLFTILSLASFCLILSCFTAFILYIFMEKPIANMIRVLTKKYCIKHKEKAGNDKMRNLVSNRDDTPSYDDNDNRTTYLDNGGDNETDLHSL